jgi:hypothetical protein
MVEASLLQGATSLQGEREIRNAMNENMPRWLALSMRIVAVKADTAPGLGQQRRCKGRPGVDATREE